MRPVNTDGLIIPEKLTGKGIGDKKFKDYMVEALKEARPSVNEKAFWDCVKSNFGDFNGSKNGRNKIHQHRKQRTCLRCHVKFISSGPGNRQCGGCAHHNSSLSFRAEMPPLDIGGFFDARG